MQPQVFSTILTILAIPVGVGTLFALIGVGWAQFKAGGEKFKDNTIDSLKESLAISEEKNKKLTEEKAQLLTSHQEQINKLTKELGELTGRFNEQSKLAEEYKLILQGRGPDDIKYKEEGRAFMLNMSKYAENSMKIFDILMERNNTVDNQKKRIARTVVKTLADDK